MSPITIGFIILGVLLIAFVIGIPIAFAMMISGLLGMIVLIQTDAGLHFLAIDIFNQFSSFPLSAIPMFILMGYYASASGITKGLFELAYAWVGWIRGGLAITTVLACALFSAVTGSSPACAATVGKIAYPEMKRYKYDDSLATGCIAGAGVLGPLIPPSAGAIIYGLLTETSIGKLFVAGILPGIMLTMFFVISVYIVCRLNPKLGPPFQSHGRRK